jgi:hypothetical protein|tara:strand:+ start:176 stop:415 length:240 start_codon:yes stop_codon:yes gene_type:complete
MTAIAFPAAVSTRDGSASTLARFSDWLEGRGGCELRIRRVAAYIPEPIRMPRLFTPVHQQGSAYGSRRVFVRLGDRRKR